MTSLRQSANLLPVRQRSQKSKGKAGRGPRNSGGPKSGRNPSRRRHSQPNRRHYVGRVEKNPRGFAFIIPQVSSLNDVYVSKEEASALLNGDVVEYLIHSDGRRNHGEIVKVLQRAQTEVVGRVESGRHGARLISLDGESFDVEDDQSPTVLGKRLGPSYSRDEKWVVARFSRYPTKHDAGTVEIEDSLGPELTPRHDYRIAIAQFGLPSEFEPAVIKEAEKMRELCEAELFTPHKRKDLRDLPFVTIDGEDAKDFDDAILVQSVTKGPPFVLYVAIADVSFFVRPRSALDKEARRRATSVYFPGRAIPMLPEVLSNDLCSLNPRDRTSSP